MKKNIVFIPCILMALVLLLGSCTKDLVTFKHAGTATVSTITTGYYNYITADKTGNVYAMHYSGGTDTIYKFDAAGNKTLFYTPAPTMGQDTAVLNKMNYLTADSAGNVYTILYAGALAKPAVLKITPAGSATVIFSNIVNATFFSIEEIEVNNGNFYFSDNQGVHKIAPDGTSTLLLPVISIFTVDKNGNVIYPVNNISNQVSLSQISPAGVTTVKAGPLKSNGDIDVVDLTADNKGNVYINGAVNDKSTIIKVSPIDTLSTVISTTFGHVDGPISTAQIGVAFDMVADGAGNLYFSEITISPADIRKITF